MDNLLSLAMKKSPIVDKREFEEDLLDIDIDISLEDKPNEIKIPEKEYSEINDKKKTDTNGASAKENIEETSRNPKRKKIISSPTFENSIEKPGIDSQEKNKFSLGKRDCKRIMKEESNKSEDAGRLVISSSKNQLDSDDDSEELETTGIKKEHNTTFSQIEEVIELDSDGEDPAYQSWCSSQFDITSNIKIEKQENEDRFSNISLDSPTRSSPRDDEFPEASSLDNGDQSDDDVIFLECDNKDLNLEGSQMALYEKIRLNIKIKKEMVESQQDGCKIDIINLASPPRKGENKDKQDNLIKLLDNEKEENNKKDDDYDNNLVSSPASEEIEMISSSYSAFNELPDLDASLDQQIDRVLDIPEDAAWQDVGNKDLERFSKSPISSPLSSPTKRQIQLIDPIPKPFKKDGKKDSFEGIRSETPQHRTLPNDKEKKYHSKSHEDRDERDKDSGKKLKHSNPYSYVGFSVKDKERRAEALKEIELKKRQQKKQLEAADIANISSKDNHSLVKTASQKIKNSQPKLAKLLPVKQSLHEVDLFGNKSSSSSPRQPIRRAHKPKLQQAFQKPKPLRSINETTSVKKSASAVINSDLPSTVVRKIAETTIDP